MNKLFLTGRHCLIRLYFGMEKTYSAGVTPWMLLFMFTFKVNKNPAQKTHKLKEKAGKETMIKFMVHRNSSWCMLWP